MFDKLAAIADKFSSLTAKTEDPEVYGDREAFARISKELKDIEPIVEAYNRYLKARSDAEAAEALLSDPDFAELAREELDAAGVQIDALTGELKRLLLPRDPNDERNVIVEIRAGVGGEEAALFAHSLYRMYTMYAEGRRWKTELSNLNETELGGIKEVSFVIEGDGAYSKLKFESGVHRVQRVPDTETSGRIHTSTATVAVLPEADEVEFEINNGDLKIDTFRASGAGGQHVNRTESAIRITHLPTGVVVECQDERSQYKNKDRAMKILRSKLLEAEHEKQNAAIASERKSQVGTGMRNERIRTYNYPQGRVTDHRINLTLYKIEAVLDGDLTEIIEGLRTAAEAERLAVIDND
ncbi:MAG: peptide chain release factor 1 [Oscillospiraceae bacterium]|jgi:peptide chain release factor 1|nr:peptide chain release factor 1 [Oscillospiraceae bacterium]